MSNDTLYNAKNQLACPMDELIEFFNLATTHNVIVSSIVAGEQYYKLLDRDRLIYDGANETLARGYMIGVLSCC